MIAIFYKRRPFWLHVPGAKEKPTYATDDSKTIVDNTVLLQYSAMDSLVCYNLFKF
jgi:hypothetical protein